MTRETPLWVSNSQCDRLGGVAPGLFFYLRQSSALAQIEGCGRGRIEQCVKDVLSIANKIDQAKTRIEQLFVVSKVQHRGHLAVAQQVRDQINRPYDDVALDAQPCLDRVLEWLDREHLRQRRQGD